jgi:putative hydrolase of the HAD superfamily
VTYECLLLDFGGVFLDSPFAAVRAFADATGADADRIIGYVFGAYDDDTDHPWHRLERGEIALGSAREEILALGAADGHRVDIFEVFATMRGVAIRDAMVEVARAAKAAGWRTGLITNNVREFGDAWRAMLPVDELFDVVVDSHEVGMRKPDPRIFRFALEQLGGIAPERTVFLDDFPGNLAAARALGMRTILVDHHWDTAVTELRGLL